METRAECLDLNRNNGTEKNPMFRFKRNIEYREELNVQISSGTLV
jgi:hypothetical protein